MAVKAGGVAQLAVNAVAVEFVFLKEPEADGNLRAGEELAGKGEHEVRKMLDE